MTVTLERFGKPVMVAVNGIAFGRGYEITVYSLHLEGRSTDPGRCH